MPRLPGTCSSCGARVEARIGEVVLGGTNSYGGCLTQYKLPTVWCDRGTDIQHECRKRC